jgi:transposase
MRDLVRARATAGRVLSKARQHLQSFLLRHDQIYRGVRAWTLAYRRWLTTVRFAHPAQQIVLQDYIHAVQGAEARLDRLTRQIEELLPSWSMAPVVAALQAMRGVALVVAVTVVAEGRRLSTLRQCTAADGLSRPGAFRTFLRRQRPARRHHQGRQCAGTARADRRSLDPGLRRGRLYRMPARISRKLHDRNEKLSPAIRDIAWKGQIRLCSRYRRLAAAGKSKVVVTTAIAREMVGFIWAIARIAQPALQG